MYNQLVIMKNQFIQKIKANANIDVEIDSDVYAVLNQQNVNVTQPLNCGQVSKALTTISIWKCQKLSIMSYQNIKLSQLIHISFPNITRIDITRCQIQTIQGINKMHVPHLKTLFLNYNNLTRLKELTKLPFPNLDDIRIHGNHYIDNEQMANLHHPKLLDLSMETITSPNKQTTNHSWVFKLQLEKLQNLWIHSKGNIQERNFMSALKGKYPLSCINK